MALSKEQAAEITKYIREELDKILPELAGKALAGKIADYETRLQLTEELAEEISKKLSDKSSESNSSDVPQDLIERLVNVEHLLGVKLPLRKVEGIGHPTSLSSSTSSAGKDDSK